MPLRFELRIYIRASFQLSKLQLVKAETGGRPCIAARLLVGVESVLKGN